MFKNQLKIIIRKIISEVLNEPKRKPKYISDIGIQQDGGYDNIIKVYNEANEEEKDYWGKWYISANSNVQDLTQEINYYPFNVVAAVVAVLSPGNKWKSNINVAKKILSWKRDNPSSDEFPKVSAYSKNIIKANNILDAYENNNEISSEEIRQLVYGKKGIKVSIFYDSIINPEETEKNIKMVADGHAINIWRGIKTKLKGVHISDSNRKKMLQDYDRAAKELGISVRALQATTWFIWKNLKNKVEK